MTEMNLSSAYWHMRPGRQRREALVAALSQTYAGLEAKLPVNNKWQANLVDRDLRYLLKKGVLARVRDRAGRKDGKRQTYLVLATKARPQGVKST